MPTPMLTNEQISQLTPEQLQAEIQRVQAEMGQGGQPQQGGFLPKAGRVFAGGLRGALTGLAGRVPEGPTMPAEEKQPVYVYDEATGTMQRAGETEKGAKIITRKAPKEEKPRAIPKGEVAGMGPAGLKTGAIVEGERVPVRPFAEPKKENYAQLSPSELTGLYESENDLEAKEEYDSRLEEAHRDISLVIQQGPDEGESTEKFKARVEQAIQADGWTLEEFPTVSIKTTPRRGIFGR